MPINPPPHTYGAAFDRAAEKRKDAAWLEAAIRDPATRIVPLDGVRPLILETDAGPRAKLATAERLPAPALQDALFLGIEAGRPHFALELGDTPLVDLGLDDAAFVELRAVKGALPPIEAALLGFARALAHWHLRHRYCGACGRETVRAQGGHVRHCDGCGLDTFPRTDPAIIVLVHHDDRCLLGRSPRFPPEMFSTLAGFVEPGEGLEACVKREVFEEVGVEVDEIAYCSSQPWPFPQSLMLGFRARATRIDLKIDRDEIEDARWLTREDLRAGAVRLPNHDSIARYLIETWLAE